MNNYGYTSIRTNLTVVAGVDRKGQSHVFENVPVILNRVNGRERSVTVLDRPNGRAVARLTAGITF